MDTGPCTCSKKRRLAFQTITATPTTTPSILGFGDYAPASFTRDVISDRGLVDSDPPIWIIHCRSAMTNRDLVWIRCICFLWCLRCNGKRQAGHHQRQRCHYSNYSPHVRPLCYKHFFMGNIKKSIACQSIKFSIQLIGTWFRPRETPLRCGLWIPLSSP